MKNHIWAMVLIVLLLGCENKKDEKKIMMPINESMMQRCVGRNSISLPQRYRQSTNTTGIFRTTGSGKQNSAFEVIVRSGRFDRKEFVAEVQKRRVEMTRGGGEKMNVVRLEKELDDGSILLRLQEIEDAYLSEISFLRGGNMVTVKLESYHGKYAEAESDLIEFARKIRDIDRTRRNAGFCLGDVEVIGNFDSENGNFWFLDGQGSDFEIDIDTYVTDDKTPLLERMKGPNSLLTIFDVNHKVLRARERTAAGMRAQEWLGWAKISDEPDAKALKFALDTMRSKPSRAQPSISITFNTAKALDDGTPTKTLVSDDEAMQLWDAVVDSLQSLEV